MNRLLILLLPIIIPIIFCILPYWFFRIRHKRNITKNEFIKIVITSLIIAFTVVVSLVIIYFNVTVMGDNYKKSYIDKDGILRKGYIENRKINGN